MTDTNAGTGIQPISPEIQANQQTETNHIIPEIQGNQTAQAVIPQNQPNQDNNEPPTYGEIYMEETRDVETGSDYGDGTYDGTDTCSPSTLDCTCFVIICECLMSCLTGICRS